MPDLTPPRAFALVDHGLTSLTGHNLTYARRVLSAAAALGLRTVVGVGSQATSLDLGAPTHPVFEHDVWSNNPAEGRLWHARAFVTRSLRRAATDRTAAVSPNPSATSAVATDRRSGRVARLLAGLWEDSQVLMSARLSAHAFADSLETFMDVGGIGAGDVVYLPTALAAELLAIDGLLERSAAARGVRWRVLLRYAPEALLVRRPLATAARRLHRRPDVDVRLYSDTEHLCSFYERLSGAPCGLLPIPVDGTPQLRAPRPAPLTVGYFGDARDEKGFDLLPEIVRQVRQASSSAPGLRFLVQANLNTSEGDPLTRPARQVLQAMSGEDLRLVEGPLTPDAYDALFQEADIVLLPYRPEHYGERSSGVLMEALMAGLPCVATAGAWMESVLGTADPPAAVITAADPVSLADALLNVAGNWAHYAEGAHALGKRMHPRADPAELVRALAAA